jgi:uncharacterized repeat protein (TIGR01451 family)
MNFITMAIADTYISFQGKFLSLKLAFAFSKNGLRQPLLLVIFVLFITSFSFSQTVTKQLYLSDPSLALDRIDPVATADATTAQTLVMGTGIEQVGAPAFSNAAQTATSHSFSYNSGTTGTNRVLIVGISYRNRDNETITGVTYNGVAMTQVGAVNNANDAQVYIFRLVNPPTGANNLDVTWSSALNQGAVVGAVTYSGVNQTTPTGTFASNSGSSTTPSVTVTGAVGQLVFGVVGGRTNNVDYTATTSGATQLWTSRPFNQQTSGSAQTLPGVASAALTWSGSNNSWAAAGVSLNPVVAGLTPVVTFTQTPALCSGLTIKAGLPISISAYLSIVSGTMPANPNITATLRYGATTIGASSTPTYNSSTGLLTWTGTLVSDVAVPAGQAISLVVTTNEAAATYRIDYDSQTKPSKISLPVSTYIDITSHQAYTAAYPGGTVISGSVLAGTTVYIRSVVTDPFGFNDITALNLTITPPGTTVASTSVATSGCTRTYEYAWNTTSLSAGTYSLPGTAKEGFEDTVTDVQSLSIDVCTPAIGTPVFSLGATSSRCQGAGTVTYTATASNSTGISYSLDATSLAGGNTINSSTGAVTYLAGWTGTSTITATATGCNGPTTSTHTATTNPTIGTPVFTLGATSNRCIGAGSVTYTASATNTTGITYSLDASSLSGGNIINSGTGAVTYAANWSGTSVITASAAGCGGPTTATHTVTITATLAVNDAATATQGSPILINVLANDLCSINPASLTIVTQPSNGTLQIGSGGAVTYLPNGNYNGIDQYSYRICSSSIPVVCDTATVDITISESSADPCDEAVNAKTFYLPFPENATQLREALLSAANTNLLTNNVRTIVSMKTPYPGTNIIYDHWEDGYEANITIPIQSTTEVWGDGILANGVAPGYPTDIIPAGGYILLDNQYAYNPRVITNIVYDGKDKIYSTTDIALSKIEGDAGASGNTVLFNVQNIKSNVVDVTRFGKLFVVPFGEDVTLGGTGAFRYTSLFMRAATNGTIVNLDYDGNNTIDVTQTLQEGEVWFYDGTASAVGVAGDVNQANDIKAGAIITSNNPIGVDLLFGGIDNYGTRNLAILPGAFYSNSYVTPVHTTLGSAPVYVFFTNSLPTTITINWTSGGGGTGSLTLPASGSNFLSLATAAGYKFESVGGEAFTAVAIIDADAAGSTYDWAFNLIPTDRLTTFSSVSWAPGSNDLSNNTNPVWVTPTANTTLYVKFDGNLTLTTPTMSPCNIPYDIAIPLTTLQSYRIFDPDNDQSGLAIYTCDGTTFASAWGQDANAGNPTSTGTPAMDVGYVMEPKCLQQLIVANDEYEVTQPSTPVIIGVSANDNGFLCTVDITSIDTTGLLPPSNGTIVLNPDGTITYTPNNGFIGLDTFEYRICSIEFPGVCDVATVIVRVADCHAIATENLIIGKVFIEQLPDDGAYTDEAFAAGVKVDLYIDANCNQVIDGAEGITQSTVSDLSGNYEFSVNNGYNAKDNLDPTASFAGNDGGLNWNANWGEVNDDGVVNTGDVRVTADAVSGGNAIRIAGPTNGISRALTFNAATGATLKFSYRRQNFNNGGEALLVQLNGATIMTIPDGDFVGTDVNYTNVVLTLSTYNANAANTLQFITNGTPATNEIFWVDNVELIYHNSPACYLVKVDPSNTGGDYTASLLNQQTGQFPALGICDKNNNLGVLPAMVAVDDAANTSTDAPIIINVIANDLPGRTDSNSVTTIGLANQPANGTVYVNQDGTITYTPNPGFIGVDDFEYKVCSVFDPLVCDIGLVSVTVSCISVANQNTLTGIVFDDINLNASKQANEDGHEAVVVKLYRDTDADGVLDAGEPVVSTDTTSALGTYQFDIVPPYATPSSTFLDQFNTNGSGTGSNGNVNWATLPWAEIGETTNFAAGAIQVTGNKLQIAGNTTQYLDQFPVNTTANQTAGTVSWAGQSWTEIGEANGFATANITITSVSGLKITGSGAATVLGAYRIAPIAGATAAALSFTATSVSLDDSDDWVQAEVASSSAGPWTALARISGASNSVTFTFNNLTIPTSLISATTTIRFVSSGVATMLTSDQVNFDNVAVSYTTVYGASRSANLSTAVAATLTLNYQESGLDLNAGDYVDLEISQNGSAPWTLLKRYTGANGNQTGNDTFNIFNYKSVATAIRFVTPATFGMSATNTVLFDNVQIRYEVPTAASYIVQLAQPLPTGYALTTPTPSPTGIQTASFTGAGAGDCQNNFGLSGADLSIFKTVDNAAPTEGDSVVFTLIAINNGPTNASGVSVTDNLPSGYTYISDNGAGAYNSGTGVWTVGIIEVLDTISLQITARVNGAGNFLNSATIIGAQTDPDSGNNTDTVSTSPNFVPQAHPNSVSTNEDSTINITVLANDNFGGNGPNSGIITITDNANHGMATVNDGGTPLDPTDDFINYVPSPNYDGADTLIYQICDSNGDCDTAIVFITINPMPDIDISTSQTCNDNGTPSVTTDDYYSLEITAVNPDPGASNQYNVYLGTDLLATATYDDSVLLEWRNSANTLRFLADGSSTYSLTIRDVNHVFDQILYITTPEANCSTCPPPACPPVTLTKIPSGVD